MEKLINDFKISFTKGDTYALAVKFKNLTEDLRTAVFTVKENGDDEPLLQKSLGAGISKIDDRAYKAEKTYKLQIQAGDTANLEPRVQYLYDLQVAVGNVVKTVIAGVFVVNQSMSGTASTTTASLEVLVDDELETEISTTPATKGIEYETDPVASAKIGNLATLSTENKETIVKAINEVNQTAVGAMGLLDGIYLYNESVPKAINANYANESARAGLATKATEADHATNADHATDADTVGGISVVEDENGALTIGSNIVPRRRLLFSGSQELLGNDSEITLIEVTGVTENSVIEVHTDNGIFNYKKSIDTFTAKPTVRDSALTFSEFETFGFSTTKVNGVWYIVATYKCYTGITLTGKKLTISAIYEVLE